MEADQRKQTEALTIRVKEQFALEKTQAQTAAREEGKKLAETAAQQKLEALTRQNVALQTTTQQQLAQAAQDKSQLLAQVNDLKANRDEEAGMAYQRRGGHPAFQNITRPPGQSSPTVPTGRTPE